MGSLKGGVWCRPRRCNDLSVIRLLALAALPQSFIKATHRSIMLLKGIFEPRGGQAT